MADLKTVPTGEDITQFLAAIPDDKKRQDSIAVMELMREVTALEPKLWASSMVGFGEYHYQYASGREGTTFLMGFAPRKDALTLYGLRASEEQAPLLSQLGKYKSGKGCLYIKSLADIDLTVLRTLMQQAFEMKSSDSD